MLVMTQNFLSNRKFPLTLENAVSSLNTALVRKVLKSQKNKMKWAVTLSSLFLLLIPTSKDSLSEYLQNGRASNLLWGEKKGSMIGMWQCFGFAAHRKITFSSEVSAVPIHFTLMKRKAAFVATGK